MCSSTRRSMAEPAPELSLRHNEAVIQLSARKIKEQFLFRVGLEERCHRLHSQVMETCESPNWSLVLWVNAVLPEAHEEYAQNFQLNKELRSALDTPTAPCTTVPACCSKSCRHRWACLPILPSDNTALVTASSAITPSATRSLRDQRPKLRPK